MKIVLLQVEKTREAYIAEGIDVYSNRLKHYVSFSLSSINVPKSVRQRSPDEQKSAESKLILNEISSDDVLVMLDEQGKEYSSSGFAAFISAQQNKSVKRLVFLIGGPYGFDRSVYERANHKISLSKMTFSHQMVRLFFAEQLYRAFTILRGEKYHHE